MKKEGTNLSRELHTATLELIYGIAEYGLPGPLDPTWFISTCPGHLKEPASLVVFSPKMGPELLLSKIEEADTREIVEEAFDDCEMPDAFYLDGLVEHYKQLVHKSEVIVDLLAAAKDIESGEAIREQVGIDRIRLVIDRSDKGGVEIPGSVDTIYMPQSHASVNDIEPDRSFHVRTGTVFDTWCVLGPGELGILLGQPNVGKSHGLIDLGAGYALTTPVNEIDIGDPVIHFSEEMGYRQVLSRYTRRISGNPSPSPKQKEKAWKAFPGNIVIESHPSGSASVDFLKKRVKEILKKLERGKPIAIICDYLQLLLYDRSNTYGSLSTVVTKARAMASEFGCPVWSGWQPQRESARINQMSTKIPGRPSSMDAPVLTMADMAECWAAPQVADYVVSINQTNDEKVLSQCRLHKAKIREVDPNNPPPPENTLPVNVDYSTSVFYR